MASKREHISAAWRFFHSGFRAWDQTAALFPSSRYLVHALTCQPELPRARAVVELGPGIGNVTRAILRRMHQDARLYAIEIDGAMVEHIRATLHDPRLHVIHGSAAEIPRLVAEAGGPPAIDAVISGLGMSLLPPDVRDAVVDGVTDVLGDDGIFVQFAYLHARAAVWSSARGFSRFSIRPFLQPHFAHLERRVITRNLPPAAVYTCRQPRRSASHGPRAA